jgi:membrane fusion protein (multidrug efflux system)
MADAMDDTTQPARGGRARWIILALVVVAVVATAVVWARSGHVSTDDAQVDGRITQISTRVGGPIVALNVTDNQAVDAGTVLAQIDPREYQVAVDRAKAELADAQANAVAAGSSVSVEAASTSSGVTSASGTVEEAQAGITVADRQVESAKAQLTATEARLRERQATATKLEKDVERWKPLVAKDEVSQQQYDATVANAQSARAAADAAQSDVAAAQTAIAVAEQRAVQARSASGRAKAELASANTAPEQLKVSKARALGAEARVKQAEAALAQAELNFERTSIKAPSAGIVGRRGIELGQVTQPNQPLMALVSRDDLWVVANFKETQLADVKPGQSATIEVDALGGKEFHGKVDSIGAATGAKFSLLPPENATGNYVKVVQRVPVKIVLDAGQDPDHRLRPGLSVFASITTK